MQFIVLLTLPNLEYNCKGKGVGPFLSLGSCLITTPLNKYVMRFKCVQLKQPYGICNFFKKKKSDLLLIKKNYL